MKIKIYAIMNWAEGEPFITAVNGMACVMRDKEKLHKIYESIHGSFPPGIRVEVVEFESGEIADDRN